MSDTAHELYGKGETLEKIYSIVVFPLAGEWYGVSANEAREVVAGAPITWVPFAPPHILGLLNLRGDIISVTHLHGILGLDSDSTPIDTQHFVVLEKDGLATALYVDGVPQVVEIPASQWDASFASFGAQKEKWFRAQIRHGGKMIAILDEKTILERTKAA